MLPPVNGGWSAPDAIGGFPVQIDESLNQRHIVRIPIRLSPGEPVNIREQDIILCDGDIVFIESRETEVFYTGGLLGGGQYTRAEAVMAFIERHLLEGALFGVAAAQLNSGGN